MRDLESPVLVLGASGRVGGGLMAELCGHGVPVRACVRDVESWAPPLGVDAVRFDLRDRGTWPAALAGVRRLFLMWPPGTSPAEHVFPFVDAAKAAGVERVAFLSVLGAERMGFLPHRKIEQHLEASGLETVLLRSGYFMQNFTGMHRDDVRLRDEVALPTGSGKLGMVDVGDVAQAACVGLVERRGSVAWDLTGPEALDMDAAASTFAEVLGRPIRNARPGAIAFYYAQTARGTPAGLARFMVAEYTHARLGLAGRLGEGVREALGREPTSFEVFVRRERESWLKARGTTRREAPSVQRSL